MCNALHTQGKGRYMGAHGARTGTLRPLRVLCMCIHGICISQGNERRIGICICSRMRCSFRKMSSQITMLTRLPGMLWIYIYIYVDIPVCRVSSGISLRPGVWHANVGAFWSQDGLWWMPWRFTQRGSALQLRYLAIVSLTWPETNLLTYLTCKTKSVFNFGIRKLQDVCDFDVCTKCSRLTSFVDDLAYQGQHWYLCLYYLHDRTLECW